MRTNLTHFVAALLRTKLHIFAAILILLPAVSRSQEYNVVDLGTFGGATSKAYAVNNAGEVAGEADTAAPDTSHAFLYTQGIKLDIGTLGGSSSRAYALNDQGDLTGTAQLPNSTYHAFIYSNGSMTDLDPTHPQASSDGFAINASDTVVGFVPIGDFASPAVFSGGQITALPYPTFDWAGGTAINDAGQIAATCVDASNTLNGCSITAGVITNFKALTALGDSFGAAINNSGEVCGYSDITGGTRAVLWSGGSTLNLGTVPGSNMSVCESLDDYGQQVGNVTPNGSSTTRAVLFNSLVGVVDVNQLISPSLGIVVTDALSISDTGYIAAECTFPDGIRGCLLKPNVVQIVKKNIYELAIGDPECIQCRIVLDPEMNSLPASLTDLSATQRQTVITTVNTVASQLQTLERARQITVSQARVLLHELTLVISALPRT